MWKQLLHKSVTVRDGPSQYSSYFLSYHGNTTAASCSYELPSDVYSPDGTTIRGQQLTLRLASKRTPGVSDTRTTGPFNSTFEDKYSATDLTDSLDFSSVTDTSHLQVSEGTDHSQQYHTSPRTLLTSVNSIGDHMTRAEQLDTPRILGERPPCIGQEASPPKTNKRQMADAAIPSGQLTGNVADLSTESDATLFMKLPINRCGLITSRRRSHGHNAIGQKLKQFGKQFHSVRKCRSTRVTLAIL